MDIFGRKGTFFSFQSVCLLEGVRQSHPTVHIYFKIAYMQTHTRTRTRK